MDENDRGWLGPSLFDWEIGLIQIYFIVFFFYFSYNLGFIYIGQSYLVG
jgi:hypothetical protein